MTASQKKPWKKYIKRDIVQGGGRGKVPSTFRGEAAYVRRLRRLEVVVLTLSMKMKLSKTELDSLLQSMLDVVDAVESPSSRSGSEFQRNAVPLLQQGPADGETEGEG